MRKRGNDGEIQFHHRDAEDAENDTFRKIGEVPIFLKLPAPSAGVILFFSRSGEAVLIRGHLSAN
jgi:hypothetical protein